MGLGGCCGLIKYLVVIVNALFWLAGIGVVGLAVWMLMDPTFIVSMAQDETNYYIGLYIFLAIGLLMLFIPCLGCCGALKESQCMLVSFFCFLLIVVVAEIAAGAWMVHNSSKLEGVLEATVKHTVQEEYGQVSSRTSAFDAIQKQLECCGANGPRDWASSRFNQVDTKNVLDLTLSKVSITYKIPESCCITDDEKLCQLSTNVVGVLASVNPAIASTGCLEKVSEKIQANMPCVIGIVGGILLVELLGMIFSIVLCCAIRSNDHYKA